MFLQPFGQTLHLQDIVLTINTFLLVAFIVLAELIHAEAPPKQRRLLRYTYPVFVALSGLLFFAIYRQGGA